MNIIGVIFILAGIVWFLQGVGILPGSFMTGHSQYAVLGVVVGAIGTVLLVLANRSRGITEDHDHTQLPPKN